MNLTHFKVTKYRNVWDSGWIDVGDLRLSGLIGLWEDRVDIEDSAMMIDILRNYPPALEWFDALDENEEIALPGYVLMELIQGCRNKAEQGRLQRAVEPYGVACMAYSRTLGQGARCLHELPFEPQCRHAGCLGR